MLIHLFISNYALIDKSEIDFEGGFTVITGETGAGKSILLGALSLIVGQRADSSALQDKNKKCIVEGIFDLKHYDLKDFFKKNNLDYQEKTIIRREINPAGSSRAFINDTPVSLQQVKEIGLSLVDIHSQHESLSLNNAEFQFNIIDSFARHHKIVSDYKIKFKEVNLLQSELNSLKEKEQKSKLDKDYFQFQFDELDKANLSEGEQEELEQQLEIMNNAGEIKRFISEGTKALIQEDRSAVNIIKEVKKFISEASRHNPIMEEVEKRILSVAIELEDIAAELEIMYDRISFSPEKTESINNRLNIIYSLLHKHRVKTTRELLEVKEKIQKQLVGIDSLEEEINILESKISKGISELKQSAKKISENRNNAIPKIEKSVNIMLKDLAMPDAKLEIRNTQIANNELTPYGTDQIKFYFTANKGSEPREINKVASGGELSRLMLSIKSLVAKLTALPTIIFDEIDTGVSGETADRVGSILQKISSGMQVISITHLPQIASRGNTHFVVYKENRNGVAKTFLKKLSEKERTHEIARLLSGEKLTPAAIENARELLRI